MILWEKLSSFHNPQNDVLLNELKSIEFKRHKDKKFEFVTKIKENVFFVLGAIFSDQFGFSSKLFRFIIGMGRN